jgi:hypothetical protein
VNFVAKKDFLVAVFKLIFAPVSSVVVELVLLAKFAAVVGTVVAVGVQATSAIASTVISTIKIDFLLIFSSMIKVFCRVYGCRADLR